MRAHLFQGSQYYPETPAQDYTRSFDTPEEAKEFAKENPRFDWWQILTDNGEELEVYEYGTYEE